MPGNHVDHVFAGALTHVVALAVGRVLEECQLQEGRRAACLPMFTQEKRRARGGFLHHADEI